MGEGHRKRRPLAQPVRKAPVGTQLTGQSPVATEAAGRPPEGCPDEVGVTGRAAEAPTIGEPASLTLADGHPQLVVARRVAEILDTRPRAARVTRCLEEGESYGGKVTQVFTDRFEAVLTRSG